MVLLIGFLWKTRSFLEILSLVTNVLGIVSAILGIVASMFALGLIGKGRILMTGTLLVVGVCGVKITSENQLKQPVR